MQAQNPDSELKLVIWNGTMNVLFSLPWCVAYFVVMALVDPVVCSGTPYSYGQFGKWGYLGALIYQLIYIPMKYRIRKVQTTEGRESSLHRLTRFTNFIYYVFVFSLYVYNCVALACRHQCDSSGLVSLLWASVLVPPILGVLGCCCFCFLVLKVVHVASRDDNPSDPNASAIKDLRTQLQDAAVQNQANSAQEGSVAMY